MKFYEKRRYSNGKREIFIFGKKIFQYQVTKLKKINRCCEISYPFLKKLYDEKNFQLIHPIGIIISPMTKIGQNCIVHQNTTLGEKNGKAPTIGDNVRICPNSVVIGDVHIGDNSIVGAGSVVVKDIPANEVWAGNPAHFIKKKI